MTAEKRRVFVTGCCGMLGSALREQLAPTMHFIGADLARPCADSFDEVYTLDVTDEDACARVIADAAPDVVIHCAAAVDVDGAEADFGAARAVNAFGTRNVARHTPERAKFVYISTDSVFDGLRGNYVEADLPCPMNNYAKTKLEGEWFARLEATDHLILRTNFFGGSSAGKRSIARWIVETLSEGRALSLFDDWMFSTLYVADMARIIDEFITAGASGLYHAAGGETCSKFEFGSEIASVFGLDASLITRAHFADSSFRAPRPRNASLDCSKAAALLGCPLPNYRDGIRAMHAGWN